MVHPAQDYRAVDMAAGKEIKAELHAQGVKSYPAVCRECNGTGKTLIGQCENCDGKGSYELAV